VNPWAQIDPTVAELASPEPWVLVSRDTPLSERIRPNSEAAPWVIDEVKRLERELAEAYAELRKQRPAIKAVFDRAVWNRATNAKPKQPMTNNRRAPHVPWKNHPPELLDPWQPALP
jgi:hypothetical protein